MLGSASTKPPTDGALAEFVLVRSDQCHVLPESMDDGLGAMIEPFAVALHAIKRVPSISGKRVLVTGGGTIGSLVATTARAFGAVVVAVTDIVEARRTKVRELGADIAFDPNSPDLHIKVMELTGLGFDVVFEASGSSRALRGAFSLVRPGGSIVQIGTIGTEDIPLPANQLMVNEIALLGSMRYGNVFDEAISIVRSGRINLNPLVDEVFPLEQSARALDAAGDKTSKLKFQIEL
jgi:L-idonate 5-dehydrogenase